MALLPITLVLAIHLAIVLLWASHATVPVDRDAAQRYLTLAWLRAPQPRDLPPPPRIPANRATRAPAVTQPAPPPPAAQPADQEAMPQRATAPQPVVPGTLDVRQLVEAAKRQGGAIDRELRAGKPAPLASDRELPIARLRGALESAYVDRSRTTVTDTMRQADGVIVYRFRRGEKVWCRQSGGIGSSIERSDGAKLAGAGSAGGAGTAGTIPCPSDQAGWSRL